VSPGSTVAPDVEARDHRTVGFGFLRGADAALSAVEALRRLSEAFEVSMALGISAVTAGPSVVAEAFAVDTSAPASKTPRSDGLIGDASTRTRTSSDVGSKTGTRARLISRTPSSVTVDRNWRPVDG